MAYPVNELGRPTKRRRLDADPKLAPEYGHEKQALNAKLKSRLELIFQKYEQDFSNIGDEIDLETGEVVVDNGHLAGLRNEQDVRGEYQDSSCSPEDDFESSHGSLDSGYPYFSLEEDCLAFGGESFGHESPRQTRKRSYETLPKTVDPLWDAPEVPGLASASAFTLRPNSTIVETDSISERSKSPERSLWAVEQPNHSRSYKRIPWRKSDDILLLSMRAKSRYTYNDLEAFFPGRCASTIRSRWRSISNPTHACWLNVHALPDIIHDWRGDQDYKDTPYSACPATAPNILQSCLSSGAKRSPLGFFRKTMPDQKESSSLQRASSRGRSTSSLRVDEEEASVILESHKKKVTGRRPPTTPSKSWRQVNNGKKSSLRSVESSQTALIHSTPDSHAAFLDDTSSLGQDNASTRLVEQEHHQPDTSTSLASANDVENKLAVSRQTFVASRSTDSPARILPIQSSSGGQSICAQPEQALRPVAATPISIRANEPLSRFHSYAFSVVTSAKLGSTTQSRPGRRQSLNRHQMPLDLQKGDDIEDELASPCPSVHQATINGRKSVKLKSRSKSHGNLETEESEKMMIVQQGRPAPAPGPEAALADLSAAEGSHGSPTTAAIATPTESVQVMTTPVTPSTRKRRVGRHSSDPPSTPLLALVDESVKVYPTDETLPYTTSLFLTPSPPAFSVANESAELDTTTKALPYTTNYTVTSHQAKPFSNSPDNKRCRHLERSRQSFCLRCVGEDELFS